jgi:hypothetical protein
VSGRSPLPVCICRTVEEFFCTYGIWGFCFVIVKKVVHWTIGWPISVEFTFSRTIFLMSVLIISFSLRLGLTNTLFSWGFPSKMCICSCLHSFYMSHQFLTLMYVSVSLLAFSRVKPRAYRNFIWVLQIIGCSRRSNWCCEASQWKSSQNLLSELLHTLTSLHQT